MTGTFVVVDDDPGMRRSLARVIQHFWPQANVEQFSGLDQIRRASLPTDIGVVISDYELGTVDTGLDVLEHFANVPVRVLFTGALQMAQADLRIRQEGGKLSGVLVASKAEAAFVERAGLVDIIRAGRRIAKK